MDKQFEICLGEGDIIIKVTVYLQSPSKEWSQEEILDYTRIKLQQGILRLRKGK